MLHNKLLKMAYLIDIEESNTDNIHITIAEKKRKYQDVSDEVKEL